MEFVENLYISEILTYPKDKIIKRMKEQKRVPSLYCIVLPTGNVGIFEIIDYSTLLSSYYLEKEVVVVGLAVSMDDANVILRRIIDDIAKKEMLDHVKEFFEKG